MRNACRRQHAKVDIRRIGSNQQGVKTCDVTQRRCVITGLYDVILRSVQRLLTTVISSLINQVMIQNDNCVF